ADAENASARHCLDAIGLELVVRPLTIRLDEHRNRVRAFERPRVDVDAQRLQIGEVRSTLLDLFFLRSQGFASSFFLIASSMPLMNFTASSVLNVRASSSASLMTTGRGGSAPRLSSSAATRRV